MDTLINDISILPEESSLPEAQPVGSSFTGQLRKLYIESYGCQMNFSDSEIVASILRQEGFDTTSDPASADLIFLNTCSIREKAETTVRHRLQQLNTFKNARPGLVVGVLGCMAERLKTQLLDEEKIVDLVAGPDAYRDLPALIDRVDDGHKAVNTFLSREETYADISPVRLNSNGVTAFISIMRGCDNMCSFCVVPFTRGRERSRDPHSVVAEAKELFDKGYREVTLLGQNVDSYKWSSEENNKARLEKRKTDDVVTFAGVLEAVAQIHPDLRVRFSTSHPKDMTDEVLHTMARYKNICPYIHLPVQSGNTDVLTRMNRGYSRTWYLERIAKIREILGPDCGLSSDIITGFCGETEQAHQDTLSLMDQVQFDFAYMFHYSERPGTPAARNLTDDVPLEIKKMRLAEIIQKQNAHSLVRYQRDVGTFQHVLIEGESRRSPLQLQGRTPSNKVVVFDRENKTKGQYVRVKITGCTAATLFGKIAE